MLVLCIYGTIVDSMMYMYMLYSMFKLCVFSCMHMYVCLAHLLLTPVILSSCCLSLPHKKMRQVKRVCPGPQLLDLP